MSRSALLVSALDSGLGLSNTWGYHVVASTYLSLTSSSLLCPRQLGRIATRQQQHCNTDEQQQQQHGISSSEESGEPPSHRRQRRPKTRDRERQRDSSSSVGAAERKKAPVMPNLRTAKLYTAEQIRNSPSRSDGVSEALEKDYRRKTCLFLKAAGKELEL